jgi:hypothetical protein
VLGLDEHRELAAAEPESLRAMALHIPARVVMYARRRILARTARAQVPRIGFQPSQPNPQPTG